MSATFVNIDRLTPLLLPCDLRDWVPEDDLVHFVIEAVEGMDLRTLRINHRGSGSAQYPPSMMLSLLIYCYASGVFSSRRIERATHRDIGVRYLTGDTHPDHDTIAKFRRDNQEAVAECFVKVLELARELKVLKVGMVSTDGSHLRANASKYKNVSYERSSELIEQLGKDVQELLAKAEAADKYDEQDGQHLPDELARREYLRSKLEEARKRLEERVRQRADAERGEYERKVAVRESREKPRRGRFIKPPDSTPKPDEQVNLVDPDSRIMRKSAQSPCEQAYNAQIVVDAQGSQLIVGARVSQCSTDHAELVRNLDSVPEVIGRPTAVLADNGYQGAEHVEELQKRQMEVYLPTGAESRQNPRRYDFRPRQRKKKMPEPKAKWIQQMKSKMESPEGRAIYALRKQTVEPVFGIIKHVLGFRQFLMRGLESVTGEWNLIAVAYNMKRLWTLAQTAF